MRPGYILEGEGAGGEKMRASELQDRTPLLPPAYESYHIDTPGVRCAAIRNHDPFHRGSFPSA